MERGIQFYRSGITAERDTLKKLAISYSTVLLLFVLGGAYGYSRIEDFEVLHTIQFSSIFALIVSVSCSFLVAGLIFKILLSSLSVHLFTLEWLSLTFLTSFVNYLLPIRSGALVKAVYLKRIKAVPYAHFTALFVMNSILRLCVGGVIGTAALGFLWLWLDLFSYRLAVCCIGAACFSVFLFLYRWKSRWLQEKVAPILQELSAGFVMLTADGKRLAVIGVLFMAQYLLFGIIFSLAYSALGQPMNFAVGLWIAVFVSMADLVSITPNNIGVQEAIMAYLSTFAGIDFSLGLLGAGLIRVVHLFLTLSVTPILMYFLVRTGDRRLTEELFAEGELAGQAISQPQP